MTWQVVFSPQGSLRLKKGSMEDFRGPPFHITHHGWVVVVNGSGPSKETGLVLPPGQNFSASAVCFAGIRCASPQRWQDQEGRTAKYVKVNCSLTYLVFWLL